MSDARAVPANGRVAHVSLQGKVQAERFSEGSWRQVSQPLTPLLRNPDGPRERELLLGDRFLVLEDHGKFSFGYARRDGYVGYVETAALHEPMKLPSHMVFVGRSYAKHTPNLKDTGPAIGLSFGSKVNVIETSGAWSEVQIANKTMFVPNLHLRPIQPCFADPVEVAEIFLGTPYLWGGNSGFGIDCSGLVQAAMLACGIDCPGDADQQQTTLGDEIPKSVLLQRGDLLFWNGHVALCVDPQRMIHANAAHMAVVYEDIQTAETRILASGDGPIIARKRLT